MKHLVTVCLIGMTGPALADCPDGAEAFVACQIENSEKFLKTCLVGDQVTYEFGTDGNPDLKLTHDVKLVDFMPWPGVGQNIWEELTIANHDYSYRVFYVIDREGEAISHSAGVTVLRNGDELVRLDCRPDTLSIGGYPSSVFDAKHAAGQVWNLDEQHWEEPRNP